MHKGTTGYTWAVLLAVLAAGSALAAPAAAPSKKPAPNGFACEMLARSTAFGLVDSSKLWTKGSFIRWEKRTGAGLRIVLIRNGKGVYQVNQATNEGQKWPKEWERDLPPQVNLVGGPQGDPQVFLKKVRAQRTGEEQFNGRPCEIWSYKSVPNKKGVRQIFRVWIAKIGRQPMKMETRVPNPRGGVNTSVVEYRSYRWGLALADNFFDVPRGAKIAVVNLQAAKLQGQRR